MLPKGPLGICDVKETQDLCGCFAPARGATTAATRSQGLIYGKTYSYGTGRRKSAVARVFIKPGKV